MKKYLRDSLLVVLGFMLCLLTLEGIKVANTENPCQQIQANIKSNNVNGISLWENYNQAVAKYIAIDDTNFQEKMNSGKAAARSFIPLIGWDISMMQEIGKPRYSACVKQEFLATIPKHLEEGRTLLSYLSGESKDKNGNLFFGSIDTSLYPSFIDYSQYLKP